jgi:hypothetical protein
MGIIWNNYKKQNIILEKQKLKSLMSGPAFQGGLEGRILKVGFQVKSDHFVWNRGIKYVVRKC